jgi:hypothetical protein
MVAAVPHLELRLLVAVAGPATAVFLVAQEPTVVVVVTHLVRVAKV